MKQMWLTSVIGKTLPLQFDQDAGFFYAYLHWTSDINVHEK